MTKKIAVSLSEQTWSRAKAVVREGRAASVSGYIATLIDRAAEEESFEEMIERWNREDGRAPDEVTRGRAAARADFDRAGLLPKRRQAKRARHG